MTKRERFVLMRGIVRLGVYMLLAWGVLEFCRFGLVCAWAVMGD